MSDNIVRKMTLKDLDTVLSWRNTPEVRQFMYSQEIITPEEHKNWFQRCQLDNNRHLLIYVHEGADAGFVQFTQTHPHVFNWGFYLSPQAHKGTGSSMGRAALDYLFNQLKGHKVCGEALQKNDKSIRYHLKLGFQQEALLREEYFDGDQFQSVYRFGLLNYEWNS